MSQASTQKQFDFNKGRTDNSPLRILVTGFEAFLGEALNPSKMIVEDLRTQDLPGLDTLILPVSYKESAETLKQHLEFNTYDKIILIGQAGGRSQISLERVALNWIESNSPDESGFQCKPSPISEILNLDPSEYEFENALFSTWLNLVQVVQNLNQQTIPACISHSAGAFVCNCLYFACLSRIKKQNLNTEVVFVHVPFLPEQILNKTPAPPAMEFQTQLKAVEILIKS